ncbi:CDP-diacylglycerol pyrophosphatase [Burkholderia sp. MS455]|uniref:CDP-diacylglycerol diphosphatase n=1 Tax=Burkholderia sp. MS455 TaxID=2811788 RepID=UPI00195C29C8|nr:CDP-diacylglycerol diphosphatase [Burkholderia sp. MS455]QRR07568.1 CDP-diacylglycerol pyrophosphatase [Burkholderia sp. MS455]
MKKFPHRQKLRNRFSRNFSATLLLLCLFTGKHAMADDRNALWNKINHQCVPDFSHGDEYAPCALVDANRGFVIYKVDNDAYQYLLLPTRKITGIEDPKLLEPGPNYLYLAWLSRTFLMERLGKPIRERDVALTVNASNARSQDQLHIHISCLSAEARSAINQTIKSGSNAPIRIGSHYFFHQKISISDLKTDNLFKIVRGKVAWAKGNIAYSGAALVNLDPTTFLLLWSSGNKQHGIFAEQIQDHSCAIAGEAKSE